MDQLSLTEANTVLRAGGIVACATETVIGLLADADNAAAIERVCAIKGRGADHPIALLVPDVTSAATCVQWSQTAGWLANAFWPGPLTMVLPAAARLNRALVRAGRVGLRVPGPSAALDLVRLAGRPLTATSANLTKMPAVFDPAALDPRVIAGVDLVLATIANGGPPSTVLDVHDGKTSIIRAGAIPERAIERALSERLGRG